MSTATIMQQIDRKTAFPLLQQNGCIAWNLFFFGTTDEELKAEGVYKIRGFELPGCGGDDEKMIKPIDWAEKTDIVTREGLEAAVAEEEKKDEK